MININGVEYKSYAEAILDLLEEVKELEDKIPDTKDFVTNESLATTLGDYAKTSALGDYAKESELSDYVKTSSTDYQKLLLDNDTHNTNWINIIADLETLE